MIFAKKKRKVINKNKEKHLEILLFYTCVPTMFMIWSTVLEIESVTNWNFLLWVIFSLLPYPHPHPFLPKNQKSQNFEKMKKVAENIIILCKCTKSYNHMIIWGTFSDIRSETDRIFCRYGPFFPHLLPPLPSPTD